LGKYQEGGEKKKVFMQKLERRQWVFSKSCSGEGGCAPGRKKRGRSGKKGLIPTPGPLLKPKEFAKKSKVFFEESFQ